MNKNLKNALSSRSFETVKVGLLQIAQHAPFIGEIASVAVLILEMTQTAHHNKAICKTIHDVVLSGMDFIESLYKEEEYSNNKPLEDFLRDVYFPTLTEIAETMETTELIKKKRSVRKFVENHVLSQDDSKALQIASSRLIHIQQQLLVLQSRGHERMMVKLIEQSDKTIELLSPIARIAMGICRIQEYAFSLEKLMKIGEIQSTMASIPDPSTHEPRKPSVLPESMRNTIASVTRSIEIPIKNISECSSTEPVINGKVVRMLYYRQQQVARKRLGQVDIMDAGQINDISLMLEILKLMDDCENVLKFIGTLQDSGSLYMITQWCENGNLEDYLARAPPNLDWSIKLKIATGIANGLVFCHDREVVQHDLRSHNVLLDDRLCPKLTGFQLSRFQAASSNNKRPENLGYYPPEKFDFTEQPYKPHGDIYSFGVLLWEIAYQEKPMKDKSSAEIINFVSKGGRPESTKEIEIIKGYEKVMKKAWSQEPSERPTADKVYEKLLKLYNERALASPTVHPSTRENSASEVLPCLSEGIPDIEEIKRLHRAGEYKEAFVKFTKLAESGNAEAFHYLGLYYQEGLYVEADEAVAMDYYGKAADRGNFESTDKYTELSLRRTFKYVKKAANEGHAPSIEKYQKMKHLFDLGPNDD